MATYNGEKYILEQLDSLRDQTYVPDEVIICDDCSTDNTLALLKKYIKNNNMKNWKVEQNINNIGWKKTFWNLLQQAKNEFIFLSDQDDIWDSNKLMFMRDWMLKYINIDLLASDYSPFYSNGNKLSSKVSFQKAKIKKLQFQDNFLKVTRPGCSFVIRKKLVTESNDLWTQNQPHDFTLWNAALLSGKAYLVDQSLISWRIHNGSADFSKKYSMLSLILHPVQKSLELLDKKIPFIDFHISFLSNCMSCINISFYNEISLHYLLFTIRKQYLISHDITLFFKTIMRYYRCYT
ncbi:glycosyltransferase, partial [Leuconostoc mesenteroides]|nr:glycosyltransferase [Leuconostoc mesenteroides]